MKRIMGVDWGERRVGIALSDETRTIASPHTFLTRSPNIDSDIGKIKDLASENDVELILLGMPIRMDGTKGQAAEEVTMVAERMRSAHGLTVQTWDERLSTAQAERTLIGGDVSRKKRKGKVDQVAAAIFLQSFLDSGAWRRT